MFCKAKSAEHSFTVFGIRNKDISNEPHQNLSRPFCRSSWWPCWHSPPPPGCPCSAGAGWTSPSASCFPRPPGELTCPGMSAVRLTFCYPLTVTCIRICLIWVVLEHRTVSWPLHSLALSSPVFSVLLPGLTNSLPALQLFLLNSLPGQRASIRSLWNLAPNKSCRSGNLVVRTENKTGLLTTTTQLTL